MSKLICHNIREAADAVCALLNGAGGVIDCSESVNLSELRMLINPAPPPLGRLDALGNRFQVAEGRDKPYAADGRFSVLKDGVVVPAEREEIADMLRSSVLLPVRWERQLSDVIGLGDFDHGELNMFAHDLGRSAGCDFERELERLGLMRRGRFTNAADVLLCRDVAARQPQTRVTAVAFEEKGDAEYEGHNRFEGYLIDVFNNLWGFFLRHACAFQSFDDANPHREAVYRFPPKAVREGLVNALAHRDYESYAGSVKLEIGKDRLVITNVGGLFGGLTQEQLGQGSVFAYRNPDIANYLTIRKMMEMVGRGVSLIREECRKANLPEPIWECTESQVKLTLFARQNGEYIIPRKEKGRVFVQEVCGELDCYNARNNRDGCPLEVSWWPKSWPESWPKSWPKSWPETNENKILSLLYFRAMSKSELALALNVSPDSNSLKQAIRGLKKGRAYIEYTLKDKPNSRFQKYRITRSGIEAIHEFMTEEVSEPHG